MAYPIQQNQTARPLIFLMVDSTDHITPKTGLTPTVTISKNGGSLASPAGAVSEIGSGLYKVAANATDSNTLGPLVLHATATGADPSDTMFEVVAYNPEDAVRLGLTALPNVAQGNSGALPTGDASGRVTVGAMAADTLTSSALAASAVTEIQSGLSTLDAAGVRSAVGLASANLDTQLSTIDDFLDTEIAAIKAKTDNLPSSPAAVGSAMTLAADSITAAVIASDAIAEIADAVWDEATSGHQAAGSTGKALTDAGSGGGGGGGTIVIERQIRLSLDTASPIAEPFAFMEEDAYTLKAYITDYNGDPVNLTGYTLTASATSTLGVEIDAPTVTAHDEALGIVDIAITTDLTAAAFTKGYLSVKLTDGTNTYITVPTEISVGAR